MEGQVNVAFRFGLRLASRLFIAAVLLPASIALAQETLLEQAERLANRGEPAEARAALARWEEGYGRTATAADRARAWFLAARLADDGAAAELHYLRVVIEGSNSPYADDALLRLGQFKIAEEEHARAIEYLGRLRRDYPTSEHGPEALLWIARAARALGDPERACGAADQGLQEAAPGDTVLVRSLTEERSNCQDVDRTYTVQVAAFKEEGAAMSLARRLLTEGYDAWVLNATDRDPLYRVRVGRHLTESEAHAQADRLAAGGHSPFLVSQSSAIDWRR